MKHGGKRIGAGRPKGSTGKDSKTRSISIRLTDLEYQELSSKAKLQDKTLTKYIRDIVTK